MNIWASTYFPSLIFPLTFAFVNVAVHSVRRVQGRTEPVPLKEIGRWYADLGRTLSRWTYMLFLPGYRKGMKEIAAARKELAKCPVLTPAYEKALGIPSDPLTVWKLWTPEDGVQDVALVPTKPTTADVQHARHNGANKAELKRRAYEAHLADVQRKIDAVAVRLNPTVASLPSPSAVSPSIQAHVELMGPNNGPCVVEEYSGFTKIRSMDGTLIRTIPTPGTPYLRTPEKP